MLVNLHQIHRYYIINQLKLKLMVNNFFSKPLNEIFFKWNESNTLYISVKVQDFLKSGYDKIPTLAGVKLDSSDIKDGIDALTVNDKLTVIYGSKMVCNNYDYYY